MGCNLRAERVKPERSWTEEVELREPMYVVLFPDELKTLLEIVELEERS